MKFKKHKVFLAIGTVVAPRSNLQRIAAAVLLGMVYVATRLQFSIHIFAGCAFARSLQEDFPTRADSSTSLNPVW